MSISPPVKIEVPFGTGGLKNTIPAAADPVTGNAGYSGGFPAINMTPKVAGGIPPFGEDFNGIFFDITTAIQFLEAGGSFPYDSAYAAAVGGYPIGALVSRTDSTGLWRNTVANNSTNPETFGAGWQPEDSGITAITMTSANVTLTALQSARSIIVISGALTSNLNLIMPTYTKRWLIINNGTGAFSVTVKTSSGSGVSVSTGTQQDVYGDGTNIQPTYVKGIARFTVNGSFTVPSGVTQIWISGCAGGGGGGGSASTSSSSSGGGGGGGAGEPILRAPFSVTPGQVIAITVGAQGTGGASAVNGLPGSSTVIGALVTLNPGLGGSAGGGASATASNGGTGASGFPGGSYGGDSGSSQPSGAAGGAGASGPFGGGGRMTKGAAANAVPGGPAFGFGAGGGGAGGITSNVTGTGAAGANGAPGIVIIEW